MLQALPTYVSSLLHGVKIAELRICFQIVQISVEGIHGDYSQ